jgi:hypothetical protein
MIRAHGLFRASEIKYDLRFSDGTFMYGATNQDLQTLGDAGYTWTVTAVYQPDQKWGIGTTPGSGGIGVTPAASALPVAKPAGGLSTTTMIIIAGVAVLVLVGGSLFGKKR